MRTRRAQACPERSHKVTAPRCPPACLCAGLYRRCCCSVCSSRCVRGTGGSSLVRRQTCDLCLRGRLPVCNTGPDARRGIRCFTSSAAVPACWVQRAACEAPAPSNVASELMSQLCRCMCCTAHVGRMTVKVSAFARARAQPPRAQQPPPPQSHAYGRQVVSVSLILASPCRPLFLRARNATPTRYHGASRPCRQGGCASAGPPNRHPFGRSANTPFPAA